jgi:asparagine synthetase B (glutamine-hydrolysing)
MRVDKVTMSTSVEARVPFLDHKLVELAMDIPTNIKIRSQAKHILKKAVEGLIPQNIINRKNRASQLLSTSGSFGSSRTIWNLPYLTRHSGSGAAQLRLCHRPFRGTPEGKERLLLPALEPLQPLPVV